MLSLVQGYSLILRGALCTREDSLYSWLNYSSAVFNILWALAVLCNGGAFWATVEVCMCCSVQAGVLSVLTKTGSSGKIGLKGLVGPGMTSQCP